MEEKKRSNIMVRTVSGVLFTAIVIAASLVSFYTFAALLLWICAAGVMEFYRLAERCDLQPRKVTGTVAACAVLLLNLAAARLEGLGGLLLAGCVLLAAAIFVTELYRRGKNPLASIATTLAGVLYVAVPLSMVGYMPMTGRDYAPEPATGGGYDPWIFLCYIFIVWANDAFAYLVGISIGRHKLFPRISPKKSWEGLFGGIAGAVGTACLIGWLTGESLIFWAGLGAVVSVGGIFGDLVESMFKRAGDVKDSGSIMPGHGGFLDRFDAMLFSAPLVYVYFTIFAM